MKTLEYSQSMLFSIERDDKNKILNLEEIASIESINPTFKTGLKIKFLDKNIQDGFYEILVSRDLFTYNVKNDEYLTYSVSSPCEDGENRKFMELIISYINDDFHKRNKD